MQENWSGKNQNSATCTLRVKTRKMADGHHALHPGAKVDSLYVPRKGGKGLLITEEWVNIESTAIRLYVKNHEDE